MKKLFYFLTVGILMTTTVFVGCKKKSSSTTATNPNPPIAVSTINSANMGNSGTAITTLSVTASTLNAILRLDVTSNVYIDKIYIMRSADNGPLAPVTLPSILTAAGQVLEVVLRPILYLFPSVLGLFYLMFLLLFVLLPPYQMCIMSGSQVLQETSLSLVKTRFLDLQY